MVDENIENPAQNEEEAQVSGQSAEFPHFEQDDENKSDKQNLDLILDIDVDVNVELGRTSMLIKDVLELSPGKVVELNKLAGETVDVYVNNSPVAKGEVVVINENFGVRITEIIGAEARIQYLGKGKQNS